MTGWFTRRGITTTESTTIPPEAITSAAITTTTAAAGLTAMVCRRGTPFVRDSMNGIIGEPATTVISNQGGTMTRSAPTEHEKRDKLRKIVNDAKSAFMVSRTKSGGLHGRPMTTVHIEHDFDTLWFPTDR